MVRAGRVHCGAVADTLALLSGVGLRGALGRMLPRGRYLPLGGCPCRSRGFDTWSPTCYGGPRWVCTPTAEAAPPRSLLRTEPSGRVRRDSERLSVNILFCGDVMGRPGREAVKKHVPRAAAAISRSTSSSSTPRTRRRGFGLTERLCGELYDCGVDVLTTGNHVWDQREIIPYIDRDPRAVAAGELPEGDAGRRLAAAPASASRNVLVVNLMGRLFMDALDDPFARLEELLARVSGWATTRRRSSSISTPRRRARRWRSAISPTAASRRCSGSHSHVPTADCQILPGGTAYQTDAGMCGDYDSVIGMQKAPAVRRFVTKMPGERPQVGRGRGDPVRHLARDRRRRPASPARSSRCGSAAVSPRTCRALLTRPRSIARLFAGRCPNPAILGC